MTSCEAQTLGGSRCGRDATNQSYFWYYDPHQRVNRVFHLCQEHSNKIVGELIQKEVGINALIEKLKKKIDHHRTEKNKSLNFSEQREAIRNARLNGTTLPKFKSIEKIDMEIKECYRKIKVYYDLRNIERNKTCRYDKCRYPLREPESDDDQIGIAYAHADFHSGNGYRREVLLFHTECGISWLMSVVLLVAKELKYVRPKLSGQGLLYDS